MLHIELHVARTEEDANALEHLGLIEFGTDESCEHCGDFVAFADDSYISCAVVLDGETEYLMCIDCIAPILDPGVF